VVDPEPSVAFYRALGLQIVGSVDLEEIYVLYLQFPDDPFMLELTVKPDGDPEWLGTPGTGHLSVVVDDLDATLEALDQKGIRPVVAPFHPGGREDVYVCFLEDPTGYRVELVHRALVPPREPIPAALSYG
jgi:lactoylglutathione lyase